MYLLSQFCLNSFFLTYSKPRSRRDELCVARLPVLPRDGKKRNRITVGLPCRVPSSPSFRGPRWPVDCRGRTLTARLAGLLGWACEAQDVGARGSEAWRGPSAAQEPSGTGRQQGLWALEPDLRLSLWHTGLRHMA